MLVNGHQCFSAPWWPYRFCTKAVNNWSGWEGSTYPRSERISIYQRMTVHIELYRYTCLYIYIVTTCICLHKNLLIGIFLKRIEIKCVLDGQAITLYSFFFIRKTLLKYIAKYWNLKATIYGFVFIKWLT